MTKDSNNIKTMEDLFKHWQMIIYYQVKPPTYACYSTIIEKHILPSLGAIPVQEFNNGRLTEFIREKQNLGLAANTISLIVFLLKSMIQIGEEIGCYPAELLRYHIPGTGSYVVRLMNQDNFHSLSEHLVLSETDFELGILIVLCTGIRVGELCGLTWGDIDFNNGILQIRRTISRIRNVDELMGTAKTILYIGAPKTNTSIRDIPLSDFILSKLQKKRRINSAYLLTGTEKCMEPRGVQRRFKHILKKYKIPDINIHALRHTFASDWIEHGFDSKALSEILGHSSVKITMDIYVHSNMNQKKKYMNRMLTMH